MSRAWAAVECQDGKVGEEMKPQRIQLSRGKGFNLQRVSVTLNGRLAVRVDRTTKWGNPFRMGREPSERIMDQWGWIINKKHPFYTPCYSVPQALKRFRQCVESHPEYIAHVKYELKGKNLACWCPLLDEQGQPVACHAMVLLEISNEE